MASIYSDHIGRSWRLDFSLPRAREAGLALAGLAVHKPTEFAALLASPAKVIDIVLTYSESPEGDVGATDGPLSRYLTLNDSAIPLAILTLIEATETCLDPGADARAVEAGVRSALGWLVGTSVAGLEAVELHVSAQTPFPAGFLDIIDS